MVYKYKVNYIIIFNPIAGKGKAVKQLPIIHNFMREKDLEYEIIYTEKTGDAIDIAESNAKEENTAIIAAGGDGTCNEVINGLMKGKGDTIPVFGVLPLGRGNDFSYGGRVPAVLDDALEILAGQNSSPLDVGIVKGGYYPEGRYFGNGIGIGFDTVVGLEAAKLKHVQDALAYVVGTAKTLIKFSDSPDIELTYNGKTILNRAIQVSIMNGNRMGGLFYMAPDAINNDGLFDLCMVDHKNRRQLIRAIMHYTKGTQKGLPGISTDRAPSYTIRAPQRRSCGACRR